MDIASKWVALAGAVMVVAGLVWAGIVVRGLQAKIKHERAEIERIHDLAAATDQDSTTLLRRAGLRFTTYNDAMYMNQDVQLAALEHVKPSLSGPYVLAVAGAVLSVVSAALALLGS